MAVEFDPSAIQAALKTEGDHWVVELELARGGSWGHADTTWQSTVISQDEVRDHVGGDRLSHVEDVIGYVEVSLRRAGWRAARTGHRVTPPTIEVWELSPASEYGRPRNLFS
jgi:hypothetical protein